MSTNLWNILRPNPNTPLPPDWRTEREAQTMAREIRAMDRLCQRRRPWGRPTASTTPTASPMALDSRIVALAKELDKPSAMTPTQRQRERRLNEPPAAVHFVDF